MTEIEQREKLRYQVRLFLQDQKDLNRLLNDRELSDEKMDLAIDLAIDDFNTTPPLLGSEYNLSVFPSLSLLIHGTAIQCLTMAGILYSRNRLNYSSGGVSVQIADKAGEYMGWINSLVQMYEMRKRDIKKSINVTGCYGGTHSEYYLPYRNRLIS